MRIMRRPLTKQAETVAVGLTTFALYVATRYPGLGGRVNYGDSAKFAFLGAIGGIGHPPGNPLYTLLTVLAVRVPGLTPATAVTLLSALFGAATIALVYGTARRTFSAVSALAAAGAVALGPIFWTFSTEPEVYTLNTFFIALAVAGATAAPLGDLSKKREGAVLRWGALALASALAGLGNHLTIICLFPPLLVQLGARLPTTFGGRARSGSMLLPVAVVLAGLIVGGGSYGYLLLRRNAAEYSEFSAVLGSETFVDFVTAKAKHTEMRLPTAAVLFGEILPRIAEFLQRQWAFPMLLCVGAGWQPLVAAWGRRPVLFLLASALLFTAFPCYFRIPDGDGHLLPVYVFAAPFLAAWIDARGTSVAKFAKVAVLAALIGPPASLHVATWTRLFSRTSVDDIGHGPVAWELPEVVRTIPVGATLWIPCNHYGCVEVVNYVRWTDPAVRERRISFAVPEEPRGYAWSDPPPPAAPATDARPAAPICSLHEEDFRDWRQRRWSTRRWDRPAHQVAGKSYEGVPIFCTFGPE
jgi:hypothetical protein